MPKHTGVFTATAAGTATVVVYLMAGPIPQQTTPGTGSPGSLCDSSKELAQSGTITIEVESAGSAYGYQGTGGLTIMMTSPAVTSTAMDGSTYVNQLGTIAASNGYYDSTISLTNGFRNYNTPALFAGRNVGNVTLQRPNGQQIAQLADTNEGTVTIKSVNHDTRTVVVSVLASGIPTSQARLVFGSGFRGNNDSNTLGSNVVFVFAK